MQLILLFHIRCSARNNNLDGGSGRHSHELSEALANVLDPHTLSDDYGIVNDILVHVHVHSSLSDLAYYDLIAFHYKLSPLSRTKQVWYSEHGR